MSSEREENDNSVGAEFEDPLSNYEPPVYQDAIAEALEEETIATLRSTPYAAVAPETSVYRALQVLAGLKVSCLLITTEERLLGIFTERDVLERVAEQFEKAKHLPVSQFMTSDPIVVYQHDPVGKALAAIAAAGYRHVPVLDIQERVVGIVSPRRVLAFLQRLAISD